MSVFVVSDNHINSILSYTVHHNMRLPGGMTPQEVANILRKENLRAYFEQYNEELSCSTIQFKLVPCISPLQCIKACSCYLYQILELEDTLAYRIVENIKEEAITHLPGYEDLDWEIL